MDESEFYEDTAPEFLELASEQRISILFRLLEKRSRVSTMAKKLDVTAQEVSRNFDRLSNAGLVKKEKDNFYHLTAYGKAVCSQIPSLSFLSKNRKYFEDHNFGNIPTKFIQRIGALENTTHVKGVVKVLEKWKNIYKNSNEYVFDIISEIPLDLTEHLIKRVKKGVRYQNIISETARIPKGRKKLFESLGYNELLEKELIRRRMRKIVNVSIILNEKEAAVMFPTKNGEPDLREMFFGQDPLFHEWCVDYFRYCWNISDTFREFKLRE
ncbi:MAG: helix-turn-helix transcriptional regulator [Nitrosopumilaceae archaeon]